MEIKRLKAIVMRVIVEIKKQKKMKKEKKKKKKKNNKNKIIFLSLQTPAVPTKGMVIQTLLLSFNLIQTLE